MRTTIDIPDSLFRELKSAAALRGETLKSFVLRAARKELNGDPAGKPPHRVKLPLVKSKEESYDVSPERLAAILEQEDIENFTGH